MGGIREFSGYPCDCGTPTAPIIYQGSHIVPADTDPRGGTIDIAGIPGHITRPGLPPTNTDDETLPWHPWLRLGVNSETVVLDRRGVELVHRELGEWLTGLGGQEGVTGRARRATTATTAARRGTRSSTVRAGRRSVWARQATNTSRRSRFVVCASKSSLGCRAIGKATLGRAS